MKDTMAQEHVALSILHTHVTRSSLANHLERVERTNTRIWDLENLLYSSFVPVPKPVLKKGYF